VDAEPEFVLAKLEIPPGWSLVERSGLPPVVIYTLPKLDHGGAELRSLQLFRHFRQVYPGLRIIVHSTSQEAGRLDAAFEQAGVTIVRGRPGLRDMVDLYRHCRRSGATIAHVNAGMKSGYYVLAAFLAGVGTRISHFRTETEDRFDIFSRARGRIGVWLMRLLGTDIVGVSAATRLYPRIPARRWRTLYNGVASEDPRLALARRREPRGGARTLLMLGRIDRNKNGVRAVAIFEALCRRDPQAELRLRFVGAGTERELARLKARIEASPMADAIAVHEVTDDPLSHLREAAALLLPSKREGLPGVVLEALSVGTPVIASDIPATREIARAAEGINLVPLDASDADWSDAVSRAMSDDRTEAIASAFARSPFLFDDHAAAVAALWGLPPVVSAAEDLPVPKSRVVQRA